MTDISLCKGGNHTMCFNCVRFLTKSNEVYQSYILGRVIKGECLYFWPVKKQYRVVDNIGELMCAWFTGETVIFENAIYRLHKIPYSTKKRTCKKRSAKLHKRNKRKGTYK